MERNFGTTYKRLKGWLRFFSTNKPYLLSFYPLIIQKTRYGITAFNCKKTENFIVLNAFLHGDYTFICESIDVRL